MVFSSPIFLFFFLPVVLVCTLVLRTELRNIALLCASLLFYAWGEAAYSTIMIISIVGNWLAALAIEHGRRRGLDKPALILGLIINFGLLGVFKYSDFFISNLNVILELLFLPRLPLPNIHLPIGISFYTFQAVAYIIDVYRRRIPVQNDPGKLGLFIALFPQLIAGPIVRYQEISEKLERRTVHTGLFADGAQRFLLGLAKKVLIANTVALPADTIFGHPVAGLSTGMAWGGAICYTLQIYFDFSGYSDMAIGIGQMLGFHFPENFNYPYVARSIQDFWRRWHMTLSQWFRDYLYIPLGGNRGSTFATYRNMIVVFFLCGLWHGASWTFVAWGLYHGLFLCLERAWLGNVLRRVPRGLAHLYTIFVVIFGWVLFRAETFSQALFFIATMLGFQPGATEAHALAHGTEPLVGCLVFTTDVWLALVCGALISMPLMPAFATALERLTVQLGPRTGAWTSVALDGVKIVGLVLLFVLCAMALASGTHNPFIYFRF